MRIDAINSGGIHLTPKLWGTLMVFEMRPAAPQVEVLIVLNRARLENCLYDIDFATIGEVNQHLWIYKRCEKYGCVVLSPSFLWSERVSGLC